MEFVKFLDNIPPPNKTYIGRFHTTEGWQDCIFTYWGIFDGEFAIQNNCTSGYLEADKLVWLRERNGEWHQSMLDITRENNGYEQHTSREPGFVEAEGEAQEGSA